ncbi:hypothetical protein ABZV91_21045 [Nocardia sp. NPDC004568]|uniref:hypothetical protein n=1 Tax=Nocardia sp. NPDC004568 TaxID=3154551 RepID=UPI00339F65E3
MNSQTSGPGNRRPSTPAKSAPGVEAARNSRERATPCRLPDQRELVAAFTGARGREAGQPLLTWATALTDLHRRRHGDPLRLPE